MISIKILALGAPFKYLPHQNWQTDGNPACGWERATSQMNTLSEHTMELCMREVYDDSQSTAGQKRTSRQSSRPHRSMTTDGAADSRVVPEVHEQENQNDEAKENDDEDGKHPTSQTMRIMKWRRRRFQNQTQQRRRAQAEEISAHNHKRTCS